MSKAFEGLSRHTTIGELLERFPLVAGGDGPETFWSVGNDVVGESGDIVLTCKTADGAAHAATVLNRFFGELEKLPPGEKQSEWTASEWLAYFGPFTVEDSSEDDIFVRVLASRNAGKCPITFKLLDADHPGGVCDQLNAFLNIMSTARKPSVPPDASVPKEAQTQVPDEHERQFRGKGFVREEKGNVPMSLNGLAKEAVTTSIMNGWDATSVLTWSGNNVHKIPALLTLVHSEVSEALEAYRNNDRLNFEEELADVIIRVLDIAGGMGIDLDGNVSRKMTKNKTRGHKHGGKRV